MTCEQCNEWLGDAVDGTLDAERQAQIDAHCRGCLACRELLADLKAIRATAATLDRLTPSPDVWRAIAAKVERPNVFRRRLAAAWPQLAAAAALVIVLGAAAWMATGAQWRGRTDSAAADLVRNAASELQLAEQHYTNAIATLEQLTVNRDSTLDPSVGILPVARQYAPQHDRRLLARKMLQHGPGEQALVEISALSVGPKKAVAMHQ